MIGRAVEKWEIPLLRKAEKDGNREVGKVVKLFNEYREDFLAEKEDEASKPVVPKELTPAEKRARTLAKKKAKAEADAEVARLKAEREAEEAKEKEEE